MLRLLCMFILVLAPGCGYVAPKLRVAEVRLAERTESGLVLDISVDAENRNEVELPLRDVNYTVTLDNGWSFTGVRSPEASLRRLGVQRIRFPAVFAITPGSEAPVGEIGCRVSGRLGYTAPSKIAKDLFDSGVRRPTVAFGGEARVDVGGAAKPSN